jgi:hypothetical protein
MVSLPQSMRLTTRLDSGRYMSPCSTRCSHESYTTPGLTTTNLSPCTGQWAVEAGPAVTLGSWSRRLAPHGDGLQSEKIAAINMAKFMR